MESIYIGGGGDHWVQSSHCWLSTPHMVVACYTSYVGSGGEPQAFMVGLCLAYGRLMAGLCLAYGGPMLGLWRAYAWLVAGLCLAYGRLMAGLWQA